MGAIYKRKRRSCAMCKPHKTGGADKRKPRQRQELILAEEEMREAKLPGPSDDDMYDWFNDDDMYGDYSSDYMELQDMIDHIYETYRGYDHPLQEAVQAELRRRIQNGNPEVFRVTLRDVMLETPS